MNVLKTRWAIPLLAIVLIGVGLLFATQFARGSLDSYRAMQFAAEHDFDAGNLDVDLVQPWMNLRYIAEAYAVPQSYLYEKLEIPKDKRASRLPLARLNRRLRLGEVNDEPAVVGRVKEIIQMYRDNPVVTGLSEGKVEPWMNVQYIANSTGIPAQAFFDAAEIPMEGNDFKPLGWLVKSIEYEPGEEHLLRAFQELVEEHDDSSKGSRRDSGKGSGGAPGEGSDKGAGEGSDKGAGEGSDKESGKGSDNDSGRGSDAERDGKKGN